MLLESDTDLKTAVFQRLTRLETAMSKVADATALHEIKGLMKLTATPMPASGDRIANDEAEASSPRQNGH
jgi:hypothetical protein